jgi:hypothetical protein
MLERRKEGKETFYKPNQDSWKRYKDSKQQTQLISRYIMDALKISINDTKELSAHIYNKVWNTIGSSGRDLDDKDDSAEAFEDAIGQIIGKKLTKEERKKFYSLYNALMDSCLKPLTDPLVFARLVTDEEIPSVVEDQILSLVKNFMAMWDFLYKHPSAVSELNEILAEDDPEREKARRKIHKRSSKCS